MIFDVSAMLAAMTVAADREATAFDRQVAATTTTGWEDVPNGIHVRPLDKTNFERTIEGNCCVMVFFHAKWCDACERLKPTYAAAAAPDDCRVVVAAVDCTAEFSLAFAHAVAKLPAVKLFVDGQPADECAAPDGRRLRRFVGHALTVARDHRVAVTAERRASEFAAAAARPRCPYLMRTGRRENWSAAERKRTTRTIDGFETEQ